MLKSPKDSSGANHLKEVRTENLLQFNSQAEKISTETHLKSDLNFDFLANLSHDYKTPLNSILSSTTLLKNKLLDTESKALVEIIERKGNYLFNLMNNTLDYYSLLSNQFSLDFLEFNLLQELGEIQTIFSEKAADKELDFSIEFGKRLPTKLYGDPARLKQILVHLLDNAIKYTASGKISVRVEVITTLHDIHTIQFRVADTGIGIKKTEYDKIWPSASVRGLTKKPQEAGHGLSMSRELCHLLGGEMDFISREGGGTTFSFSVKMKEPLQIDKKPQDFKHLLLVEDDLINQRLTLMILENQGYSVEVANNGLVAVEKFKSSPFDLILMDVQMPVMNGLEATREIRRIENTLGSSPRVMIYALTANAQIQDRKNCVDVGMDGFINKPFNMEKLPHLIHTWESA